MASLTYCLINLGVFEPLVIHLPCENSILFNFSSSRGVTVSVSIHLRIELGLRAVYLGPIKTLGLSRFAPFQAEDAERERQAQELEKQREREVRLFFKKKREGRLFQKKKKREAKLCFNKGRGKSYLIKKEVRHLIREREVTM